MIKEYIITGKGYYKTMVSDPFIKGMEMCDIKSGYGYIEFKGTEEQLDAFRDLGNSRLSSTIFLLRKKGYNIVSDFTDVPTRFLQPNGDRKFTQVVRYRLLPSQ